MSKRIIGSYNSEHMAPNDTSDSNSSKPHLVAVNSNEAKTTNQSTLYSLKERLIKLFSLRNGNTLEESVVELIEEHNSDGKQISTEERELVHNLLGFGEVKVSEAMTSRTEIVAVPDDITLNKLQKLILKEEHTRMPVYHENLDNILGFIHIKDLIPYLGSSKIFNIEDIIRKALFVPPSMRVLDLLVKMRSQRVHLALVMDEYGGTDGLVTMEDLMEELVGEIKDEHDDVEEAEIIAINEKTLEASALLEIETLEERLNTSFTNEENEDDYETLGGLIFSLFGRVPLKGEKISHHSGIEFEILEATPRRVKRVLIHHNKL